MRSRASGSANLTVAIRFGLAGSLADALASEMDETLRTWLSPKSYRGAVMKCKIATSSRPTGRPKSISARVFGCSMMTSGSRRSASTMLVLPVPVSSAFACRCTIGSSLPCANLAYAELAAGFTISQTSLIR